MNTHLPRLLDPYYRGNAYIFWTHTMKGRSEGWLTPLFHYRFREVLLHVLHRYHLICPAYCLMPDHFHLLWIGLDPQSDQKNATGFLRKHLHGALGAFKLQSQAYDRVLREADRERNAVTLTCGYILDNPVRAGLASSREEYEYCGAAAPGYPRFDPSDAGFQNLFWDIYHKENACSH